MLALAVAGCGFSSCSSQALECRLGGVVLLTTWDLPRPGIKLVSLALAGRFFTTEPREALQPFYLDIIYRRVAKI